MEPVLEFMEYFFPDTDKMTFNDNDKIKVGYNHVNMDGKNVANFGAFKIGDLKIDPKNLFKPEQLSKFGFTGTEIFPNSILLNGTFLLSREFEGGGIPKAIVNKIFKDNPEISNIFVYGFDWKNEPYIWKKLGGKSIISTQEGDNPEGLHLIQITRTK